MEEMSIVTSRHRRLRWMALNGLAFWTSSGLFPTPRFGPERRSDVVTLLQEFAFLSFSAKDMAGTITTLYHFHLRCIARWLLC